MYALLGSISFLLLVIIGTMIMFLKKEWFMKHSTLMNIIYVSIMTGSLVLLLIKHYYDLLDETKWYFYNALTFVNMSPFLFTFGPFIFLLNAKSNAVFKSVYSYLSIALAFVAVVGPYSCYLQNHINKFTFAMLFDGLSHLCVYFLGIHFIITNQVDCNKKGWINSIIGISIILGFVLSSNFLFHTNFFGLGYFSDYNLYQIVRLPNYWLTLFIYLMCILSITLISFGFFTIYKKYKDREINQTGIN